MEKVPEANQSAALLEAVTSLISLFGVAGVVGGALGKVAVELGVPKFDCVFSPLSRLAVSASDGPISVTEDEISLIVACVPCSTGKIKGSVPLISGSILSQARNHHYLQ